MPFIGTSKDSLLFFESIGRPVPMYYNPGLGLKIHPVRMDNPFHLDGFDPDGFLTLIKLIIISKFSTKPKDSTPKMLSQGP